MARSHKVLKQSLKTFHVVNGTGFCMSGGMEGTARRFDPVGCDDAEANCGSDHACVGFACTDEFKRSVLYTSTDCQMQCDQTDWLDDPSLIDRAFADSSQPHWMNATCHVMNPTTSTTTTTLRACHAIQDAETCTADVHCMWQGYVCQLACSTDDHIELEVHYEGNDESSHTNIASYEACSNLCAGRAVPFFSYCSESKDCWCKTKNERDPVHRTQYISGYSCAISTTTPIPT